ncbi:ubiquitin-conjugating enzyme E2 [Desulfogranum marinum]|uniref:ubiquitin-conjugating enzyme E2 n=1 Tax=Desulfogranum marinum TaxID=453220 RepID=UPI001965619C|nr:ubiquitin-conjugating enzyme E2 [Desulfogranum marinum]MBM9511739.1 hypothetical protein [Desulfogranum marinum]
MVTGSQQLVDDFEQLQSSLELYPKINIVKTDGEPPDNYEIEFTLRGYIKDADGTVSIGNTHRVQISLPFGYPHFAPIVKPLTHIFHPDVDPAAIRIADRWQQNPSLADLVLYIGEMICGHTYSLNDPFNQEAADWYQEHLGNLPLDSLSIATIEESSQEIDSLVDDTFASLGLETDDFLEPVKEFSPADVEHIQMLIEHKQLFEATQALTEITEQFQEREVIQENIDKGMKKAEQLFALAEQLEDLGKFDEAVDVVDNLFEVCVDMPGSDSLRSRLQQEFSLALRSPGNSAEEQSEDSLIVSKKDKTKKKSSAKKKQKQVAPAPRPRLKFKPKIPLQIILSATVLLAICIGAISFYFKDQNILSRSQANILKSQLLIDKKQFETAQGTLYEAKKSLSGLTVLRFKKGEMEREIEKLLTSKELDEGLKGHVLYQGKYIPSAMAQSLRELATLTEQAKSLVDQKNPADALTLYRQAFFYAQKNKLSDNVAELEAIIKSLELQQTLTLAEQAELGKNWQGAAETYRKALELSSSLSDPKTATAITSRLTAATFRHELNMSKETFTQEQWQETIVKLEHAQRLIDSNPDVVSVKERRDLHRLLVNARLYGILSSARDAYNQKNWANAITEYRKAVSLLEQERDNFEGHLDESISKIKKTVLMVQIAMTQEKVLLAENQDNLQEALRHSKEIQRRIKNSPFKNDPSVEDVQRRITQQITTKEEQIAHNKKIVWLEEHFEEIFRSNYPTFRGSQLHSPNAALLRKVDDKSIFIITCTEKSQGTSSRLELNYMYDEGTGKWSVYTGE